jgi:fatty-acyl-CoA synthase
MGAVLHTLNLRLHPSQLSYIARHSEDRVIIVDADLVPLLQKFLEEVPSVRHVIVVGEANLAMLAHEHKGCPLPPLHEPGRTGRTPRCLGRGRGGRGRRAVLHDRHDDPKGVAYCHRSTYLHTLMISSGSAYGFTDAYTVLPVVPMFHANAWGWVHAAWTAGSNLVMSGRFLQAPHLAAMIEKQRPTMLAAVPTIWSSLSEHAHSEGIDLTCLRVAVSGGSAAIARPGATASRQEQPPAHPGLGHDRDISPAHLLAPAGGSSDERGGRMDDTNRSAHPGVMALSVQVAPA